MGDLLLTQNTHPSGTRSRDKTPGPSPTHVSHNSKATGKIPACRLQQQLPHTPWDPVMHKSPLCPKFQPFMANSVTPWDRNIYAQRTEQALKVAPWDTDIYWTGTAERED